MSQAAHTTPSRRPDLLAKGDLAFRIETVFEPNCDQLRRDFNGALDTLNGAMAHLGENASASNDLASRKSA